MKKILLDAGSNAFSYSTTVATLNAGVALSASTAYTVTYHCLGN